MNVKEEELNGMVGDRKTLQRRSWKWEEGEVEGEECEAEEGDGDEGGWVEWDGGGRQEDGARIEVSAHSSDTL